MSNIEEGFEAFQTFLQTLNSVLDELEAGVPKRSILRSPSTSIGIGCACADAGTKIAVRSNECVEI